MRVLLFYFIKEMNFFIFFYLFIRVCKMKSKKKNMNAKNVSYVILFYKKMNFLFSFIYL